MTGRVEK